MAKNAAKKEKKVWRIFNFRERCELRDDERKCRQSALLFTKDYVTPASGDEASKYFNQFGLLNNGDGLHNAMMQGLYRQLVRLSACQSRAKRGLLLDARDEPLSAGQIGKLLNVPGRKMLSLLQQFQSVDLVEHVEMPKLDYEQNEPPNADKKDNQSAGSDTKKRASRGQKGSSGGTRRKRSENSAKARSSLKKKNKDNRA